MAKNSQYGRWRRAAMQAVLWVVFAATLALAGYVSHRRTASLAPQLAEPVTFGELSVRLPAGWEPKERNAPPPAALIAHERDDEGRDLRQLWITREKQETVRRGPGFYLESSLNLPDSDARPESFDFLGGRGVLFVWRGIPRGFFIDEDLIEGLPEPGLYACTVLRDGLTVTVQVRGEGAFGPSSRALLRKVADSMSLGGGATRPATTSATTSPVEK
jgi:hypothetical protein